MCGIMVVSWEVLRPVNKNRDGAYCMGKIANVLLTWFSSLLERRKEKKKRKRIGNYRRQKTYSKKAKDFIQRPFVYSSIPKTEKALIVAYGVLEYYKYYGKRYLLQAVEVAMSLWSDILQLDLVASMSPESLKGYNIPAVNACFNELLLKYGHLDIVFHKHKYRKLKYVSCKATSSKAGDHFYLTEQKIGMPVRMFLAWYKGGVSIPNDILQEWSGIPADKLEDAYQCILQIFRDDLKATGRWDMLACSIQKVKETTIYV